MTSSGNASNKDEEEEEEEDDNDDMGWCCWTWGAFSLDAKVLDLHDDEDDGEGGKDGTQDTSSAVVEPVASSSDAEEDAEEEADFLRRSMSSQQGLAVSSSSTWCSNAVTVSGDAAPAKTEDEVASTMATPKPATVCMCVYLLFLWYDAQRPNPVAPLFVAFDAAAKATAAIKVQLDSP
jgi:hypothetical protein